MGRRRRATVAAGAPGDRPDLALDGVQGDTCTATRIHPPEHAYIENTIASMRAAFDAGADMLEFDVQVTADGQLAVFHDATLQCRTNGTGRVRDHTLAELRLLDLGYGYTADGGATYPLRGQAIGLMPTVPEVVAAFPDRELLIDLKNDDPSEGDRLAAYLATLPAERLTTISVYGGDARSPPSRTRLPELRATSKKIMKDCLVRYFALGWTGTYPAPAVTPNFTCHSGTAVCSGAGRTCSSTGCVPLDTRVILVAGDGPWSDGFDQPEDLNAYRRIGPAGSGRTAPTSSRSNTVVTHHARLTAAPQASRRNPAGISWSVETETKSALCPAQ